VHTPFEQRSLSHSAGTAHGAPSGFGAEQTPSISQTDPGSHPPVQGAPSFAATSQVPDGDPEFAIEETEHEPDVHSASELQAPPSATNGVK